jgi:hypothetical protein
MPAGFDAQKERTMTSHTDTPYDDGLGPNGGFAPDDYSADPDSGSHPGPGTVDDLPLDYGQELPDPADQHLIPDHAKLRRGECREDEIAREDLGIADEDELWSAQQALVDEDEHSGLRLEGLGDTRVGAVLDAMGDDAAETLPDAPEGKSATGTE